MRPLQASQQARGPALRYPDQAKLQGEYEVRVLNTIRAAQRLLIDEGLLEIRQGIGAFVIATEPPRRVDVVDELTRAHDMLTSAIGTLRAPQHTITFDLADEGHVFFVLTEALREFADRQRSEAADDPHPDVRLRWAETAEEAIERLEAAR